MGRDLEVRLKIGENYSGTERLYLLLSEEKSERLRLEVGGLSRMCNNVEFEGIYCEFSVLRRYTRISSMKD